jgi:hypothetical protein
MARPGRRPTGPATSQPEAPVPAQAFTGDLIVLRRMARVRKGTVVAMFTADEKPLLREPGELLLPDRNPLKHRISVMPISTEPVGLRVRVVDLLTLDGQHLDAIEISVSVQLNQAEPTRILDLAAQRGPQLGAFLNEQVREGIENTARAGIKMNTRAELARQGVAETLRERWLPKSFVGLLRIVDFAVIAEEWAPTTVVRRPHGSAPIKPDGPSDVASAEPPSSRSAATQPTQPTQRTRDPMGPPEPMAPPDRTQQPTTADHDADLQVDVRLLAGWRRRLPSRMPRGIASAKVAEDACVIAVVDEEPPAFEERQLWEDFAGMLDDRQLSFLLCRGRTYDEVIRSWFAQLGLPMRMEVQLGVEVGRDRLEIRLPAELEDLSGGPSGRGSGSGGWSGRAWTGLNGPQVAALRRLLGRRKLAISYEERN